MGYIKFPKIFADELKPKMDGAIEIIKNSLVNNKPLTVQEWSEVQKILITVKVGLRSEEEHAEMMKRIKEAA